MQPTDLPAARATSSTAAAYPTPTTSRRNTRIPTPANSRKVEASAIHPPSWLLQSRRQARPVRETSRQNSSGEAARMRTASTASSAPKRASLPRRDWKDLVKQNFSSSRGKSTQAQKMSHSRYPSSCGASRQGRTSTLKYNQQVPVASTTRQNSTAFSFFTIFSFQFSGMLRSRVIRSRTDRPLSRTKRRSTDSLTASAHSTVRAIETMVVGPAERERMVTSSSRGRRRTKRRQRRKPASPWRQQLGRNSSFSVLLLLRRLIGISSCSICHSSLAQLPVSLPRLDGLGCAGCRLKAGRSSFETRSRSSELTIDLRSTIS